MAVLKFGSIVTEGSGSVAGHTVQHSKGGMQLRNKPVPRNQATAAQLTIRNINKQLQQGWRALTDAERNIWNQYAVTHNITNKTGDPHPLSGHSLWMKYNYYFASAGLSLKLDPAAAALGPFGPELAQSWYNHPGYPFETFIVDGLNIISAINTTGFGFAYTLAVFPLAIGEQYSVVLSFELNSGTVDYITLGNTTNLTVASNTIVPLNGTHTYVFTSTQNTPAGTFAFRCSMPANFSSAAVSVKRLL